MTIDKLKKQEIPEILELYKELSEYENKIATSEEVFDMMDSDKNYYLLVAKENDKIIGTVLGIVCYSIPLVGTPFMVVEDVVVKEEFRQKGVGKMLFEEIDKIAKMNNCGYTILVSGEKREIAHKFYEKQGYADKVKGFRKKYI